MSTDPAGRKDRAQDARERRPPSKDGLLIVGVVGRAGSGKTTVARILKAQGAQLIEADVIGHQVTDTDPQVRAALEAEYGPNVYRPGGSLDRARVGARVFSDPEALARLNALVHPRIVSAILARIEALRADRYRGPVVVDAALMLDWGLERECDVVLAVVAPEAQQVARLMRSRDWSESDARARLAAQRSNAEFRAAADEVIENDADASALLAVTRATYKRIVSKSRA
jgi:dephospho-CoA kinase